MLIALERACDTGSETGLPEACSSFASIVLSPEVDKHEWPRARWREVWSLLQGACAREDPHACRRLSGYYMMSYPSVRQRCDTGDLFACFTLTAGQEVIDKLSPEQPLSPQFHPLHSRARAQLEITCRGQISSGCVDLGRMLWRGYGGPSDQERARRLLKTACEAQFEGACEISRQMSGASSAP